MSKKYVDIKDGKIVSKEDDTEKENQKLKKETKDEKIKNIRGDKKEYLGGDGSKNTDNKNLREEIDYFNKLKEEKEKNNKSKKIYLFFKRIKQAFIGLLSRLIILIVVIIILLTSFLILNTNKEIPSEEEYVDIEEVEIIDNEKEPIKEPIKNLKREEVEKLVKEINAIENFRNNIENFKKDEINIVDKFLRNIIGEKELDIYFQQSLAFKEEVFVDFSKYKTINYLENYYELNLRHSRNSINLSKQIIKTLKGNTTKNEIRNIVINYQKTNLKLSNEIDLMKNQIYKRFNIKKD